MKNVTKLLAIYKTATIIALAVVIAFSFVACVSSTTRGEVGVDPSLNGTWVNQANERWVFNNGSFIILVDNVESVRGEYYTRGDRITITILQVRGSTFGSSGPTIGISASQWYTKSEMRTTIVNYGITQGLSRSQAGGAADTALRENSFYDPMTGRYSVSGNTLTIGRAILTGETLIASPVSTAPIPGARYMLVNAGTLNVRSGPSADYAAVGQVTQGARVQVLESTGTWWRIRSGSVEGYVNSAYLSAE